MNTLGTFFASLYIAFFVAGTAVSIPELTQQDSKKEWTALPSGLVSVRIEEKLWAIFPAKTVPCSDRYEEHGVQVFFITAPKGAFPACYLVYPEAIGYHASDPSDSKNFELEFTPTFKRTWK